MSGNAYENLIFHMAEKNKHRCRSSTD